MSKSSTSTLPLSETPSNVPEPGNTVLLMEMLQGTPITAHEMDGCRPNMFKGEENGITRVAEKAIPMCMRRSLLMELTFGTVLHKSSHIFVKSRPPNSTSSQASHSENTWMTCM